MNRRIFLPTLSPALIALGFVCGTAHADLIYVAPATGTGVGTEDLVATSELIRTAVPEVSSDKTVSQPGQADFVLQPRLMRLGQAYILTISKVRNGDVVYSTQLKAERMDELDKVATRVTRSVLENKRSSTHARVGEVTDQEARDGAQRKPTHKAWYLGLGGSSLSNLNTTGLGYSLAAAYTWDVNYMRLKLYGEGDVNGAAFFTSGGIGGNYYFSLEDIAPYASMDFGGGAAKVDQGLLNGQTIGGFVLGVGAGIEFLRTSSVNIDLGFHAGFLMHENQYGKPAAVTFRLGIYF